ncbi:MAG TPA: flagellar biosynthetic protein FliQ [Caulobacteraceae bacterium]|nr:flagellar biosynthetic protein FliQ [Caulobacteraceae bacterium]
MGADQALELMNGMLWNTLVVAAPVMAAALAGGLLVSVLQVATQLQEQTLSYVPKLLAAAVVLIALGPWMIHKITAFALETFKTIPALG